MNLNAARRLRRCVSGFSIAGWRTWRESNPLSSLYLEIEGFPIYMPFDSFPDGLPAGESGPGGGELMSSLFCRTLGNRIPIDPS